MGTPVRILQLARRLLAVAEERGYSPVPIEFSGLRPGEKLTEEFPTSDVVPYDTRTSLIYRLRYTNAAPLQSEHVLSDLQGFVARADAASVLRILTTTYPSLSRATSRSLRPATSHAQHRYGKRPNDTIFPTRRIGGSVRVLTFNWHEAYICLLAKTGHALAARG